VRSRLAVLLALVALGAGMAGSQWSSVWYDPWTFSSIAAIALLPVPAMLLAGRRDRAPESQRSGEPWSAPPKPLRLLVPAGATFGIPPCAPRRPRRRRRLRRRRR
jgi:hypothetical protein